MNKPLSITRGWILILIACLCAAFLFAPAAHADTDGTELQVTGQPDVLVIQLGPQWAGAEFELRTDVGVYPQSIVVSPEGILTMELGGSKTYTLSAMNTQGPAAPVVSTENDQSVDEPVAAENSVQPSHEGESVPLEENPDETHEAGSTDSNIIPGIPNMHLFLFAGGLIACIAGLIIMAIMKRRRNYQYDDADDYGDYDE